MPDAMTPTEWFDQFPPLTDPTQWNAEGQWCARHWAPCPVLGANGMLASVMIMQTFIDEMRPEGCDTPEAMNAYMHNVGYLCCTLGDDRMYALWGKCPPAGWPASA